MKIDLLDFKNFGTDCNRWFHPSITLLHDGRLFASMQKTIGSDHYGAPMFALGNGLDGGWSAPSEIPAFQCRAVEGMPFTEGVADVRPFTLQDGRVAVFGCTSYYTPNGNAYWDNANTDEPPFGCAVYAIWSPSTGEWSSRGILELNGVTRSYRTACTQAVLLENDRILLPIYLDSGRTCDYYGQKSPCFASMTAIYRINGTQLVLEAQGDLLELPVLRGCIEPSAVRLADAAFALTLRAEDGNMYRAISNDGLSWRDLRPWRWDDGTTIKTDSTQQHWIRLGEKTFLVYTRNNGSNTGIMRFRAPLYIAEADVATATLLRDSERVLFPQKSLDGIEAAYGNFHCAPFGENAAVVTDSALFVKENCFRTIVMAALVTC